MISFHRQSRPHRTGRRVGRSSKPETAAVDVDQPDAPGIPPGPEPEKRWSAIGRPVGQIRPETSIDELDASCAVRAATPQRLFRIPDIGYPRTVPRILDSIGGYPIKVTLPA